VTDAVATSAAFRGATAPRRRLTPGEHQALARRYRLARAFTGYAFLAPAFLFFALFMIYPMVRVILYSFESGGVLSQQKFVGLDNWSKVLGSGLVHTVFGNTVEYAIIAIPGMIIVGIATGLVMQNIGRGATPLRAMIYFPTLAPVVVAALIWLFVIQPDFGAVNLGIRALGGSSVNFLGSSTLALPTVAMLEIWRGIGYWGLFFLAQLIGLPKELYEAAHLDGTNAWQRFRYLTIPLLRPALLYAVFLTTIYNLQLFDSVFVLTDGGPANATTTVVWYIYKTLFTFDQIGPSATASVLLLFVILLLTLAQMRFLGVRKVAVK
jgi:multiple sugar transport system permease protein